MTTHLHWPSLVHEHLAGEEDHAHVIKDGCRNAPGIETILLGDEIPRGRTASFSLPARSTGRWSMSPNADYVRRYPGHEICEVCGGEIHLSTIGSGFDHPAWVHLHWKDWFGNPHPAVPPIGSSGTQS